MEFRTVKPFLKWAGGKSQLLEEIRNKYPCEIARYCEPFVGGGAVLFDVLANFPVKDVLINDINFELINTYMQVRDNVFALIGELSQLQEDFLNANEEKRKEIFLTKRERFNMLKTTQQNHNLELAQLFIFLNKTCFNGLYRVNKKNLFNVPMGSYKKPTICDADNLQTISKLLSNVEIRCGDYQKCADFIDQNTFVYIDPPYRPLTATASFTSYSENGFGDEEQIALGKFIEQIAMRGAKVLASNSDPKNTDVNDNFFDEIYRNFIINKVKSTRMINSNSSGRGAINELLICNF